MPGGLDGLEATRKVRTTAPDVGLLVLTMTTTCRRSSREPGVTGRTEAALLTGDHGLGRH